MLATMSCGNRIELTAPVLTPTMQRRRVERAVEAQQPADAEQREAEAELDRRELRGDEHQEREAVWPSGNLVLMMPNALRSMIPWNESSSAPKYSPAAGSNRRKPPPLMTPVSTLRPAPFGGLNRNAEVERADVAVPARREAQVDRRARSPGPRCRARRAAPRCRPRARPGTCSPATPTPSVRASIATGPRTGAPAA